MKEHSNYVKRSQRDYNMSLKPVQLLFSGLEDLVVLIGRTKPQSK
jgi:hypothetical protein